MPELANFVGFAMIDNFDARNPGAIEAPPPVPSPTPCLPTKKSGDSALLPTRKPAADCVSPGEFDAVRRQSLEQQIAAVQKRLLWGRVIGLDGEQKPGGYSWSNPFSNGPNFSYALGGFEAGITPWRNLARDGSVDDLGAYVGYAISNANVNAIYGGLKAGTVTIDSYSLGTYWTHFSPAGWYLDTVLQGTWYGEVNGAAGFTGLSVSGGGLAASVTGGRPFLLSPYWTVEPQVQLTYQNVQLGSGSDYFGVANFVRTNDLRGRLGVKASYRLGDGENPIALPVTVWARASVLHDFLLNAPAVSFSDFGSSDPFTLAGTLAGTSAELDLGAETNVRSNVKLTGSIVFYRSVDEAASWAIGGWVGAKVEF